MSNNCNMVWTHFVFVIYIVVGGFTFNVVYRESVRNVNSCRYCQDYNTSIHTPSWRFLPHIYAIREIVEAFFSPKVRLCCKDKTHRLSLGKSNFLNYKNHIISFCPLLMFSCLLYSTLLKQSHKKTFSAFHDRTRLKLEEMKWASCCIRNVRNWLINCMW